MRHPCFGVPRFALAGAGSTIGAGGCATSDCLGLSGTSVPDCRSAPLVASGAPVDCVPAPSGAPAGVSVAPPVYPDGCGGSDDLLVVVEGVCTCRSVGYPYLLKKKH